MKFLWKLGEAVWAIANLAIGLLLIFGLIYLLKQHVTCYDFVQWCIIH